MEAEDFLLFSDDILLPELVLVILGSSHPEPSDRGFKDLLHIKHIKREVNPTLVIAIAKNITYCFEWSEFLILGGPLWHVRCCKWGCNTVEFGNG